MAKPKWPDEGVYLLIELYGLSVWLFIDIKLYHQALRCIQVEIDSTPACGLTTYSVHKDGSGVFIIGVFDEDPSTLVHELAHTTLFMCEHLGFSPSEANGEPFAYLQEYLYTNLLSHIYKQEIKPCL